MASTNGKVAKQSTFAGRRVRGYRRPLDNYYLLHPALREGQFSLYDVPAMMMDDTILIGLSAIYGAISGATFEVRANSPEIKTFVENTLFRFWHHDLSKALHHYVPWGTFAGEAMYEQDIDSGLWRYAGVDDFDVRDVQPWKRGRHLSKIRVSPGGMGVIEPEGYKRTEEDPTEWNVVRAPKIFWVAHRPLCGNLRGHSAFEASWGPWMEKCGTHGAISIRRLWAFANAFRGVIVKYPEGFTEREDGTQISNADIAREIAENWTTGGASICPSAKDENGNPLWEIIDAKMNGDIASMLEYPKDMNRAILRGMGVLDEVITAPDVGGSWSGRSGPLLIFLNSCDFRVKEIVTGFDVGPSGYTTRSEQSGGIIRPLVIENFGPKAKYEIRPISLVPKPAEPGAGGTGGAPGLPPGLPPGPGSPMGPPPGQMDVPTQPAGGNPIKLSGADDGSVELPDAEVEAILSGDVQLSATGTMSVKPIKQAQPAKAAEASTPKAPAQTKPLFTGTITDSLNREYHFVDGVRVPGQQEVQQRQQAGQSVQNIKHDAEHTEESAQAHAASVAQPQQAQQPQQSHKFKSTVEADAHGDRIIQGEQLRPHEQAAVQKYRSTDTCYRVNSYLRGQGKFLDRLFGLPSEAKNMMEDLDATIKKSTITEPVTLMRGFRLEPHENPLEKLKPGTTFSDNGYVSTTLAEDVAKKFSISSYQHRVVMEIDVPKGANGYKMPRAAGQYDEAEVVMPRGSKFAITGIEKTVEGVFRVKAKYLGAPSNSIQLSAGMQPQPNGNAPANIERSDRFLWSMGDLQFDDPVQMSAGHDVSNEPRDDHGRWSKGPGAAIAGAIGVSKEAYHAIHEGVSEVFHSLPEPVQKAVSAVKATAFSGWTASQALAERISKEKGSTPEEARKTRETLAWWDLVAFKPMAMATAGLGTGVATASWVIPPVTGAYLAYSTVRHPVATALAAYGIVKDFLGAAKKVIDDHTVTLSALELSAPQTLLLEAREKHGWDDWHGALLCMSLQETKDAAKAVEVADAIFAKHPKDESKPKPDDADRLFGANVKLSASTPDDNSTEDLANLYAHMWHGLTPEEVGEKELGTVHDELADGEHHLHWNSKVGWHVKHTSEDSDVQMSTKHAPKGGIVIAGKVFKGGMFIPNEDYQKATPEEKAAIDNPKEARADVRKARGSINHDTLQEKLAAHAHHELTKQELTSAKRSFNALHRHHGDLVLHRLEEIADMLQAAHDREGNTEGQTEQYSRRLKAVQHQIEMAKGKGVHGEVAAKVKAASPLDELLDQSEKYRNYGPDYDRNIASSARRVEEMKNAGRDKEAEHWAKELKARLDAKTEAAPTMPEPIPPAGEKPGRYRKADVKTLARYAEGWFALDTNGMPLKFVAEYDTLANDLAKKFPGASTTLNGTAKVSAAELSKLKEAAKKQKRGTFALRSIVKDMGGISYKSLEALGFSVKDLREMGIGGLFSQNGRSLEEIASSLHSEGHIIIPGVEYTGDVDTKAARGTVLPIESAQYVLDQLESKAKSLHADHSKAYEKSYKQYLKDQADAKQEYTPAEISEAESIEDSDVEGEETHGDSWEGPEGVAASKGEVDPWDMPDEAVAPEKPKVVRFESGKKLSAEERKQVLRSVVDAYKDTGHEKELAGFTKNDEEIWRYPYDPERFAVSDITGAKLRYYITLPDGRKAHPSELFPNIAHAEVLKAMNEEEHAKKVAEGFDKARKDRAAESKQDANASYVKTGRPLPHSYFAESPEGKIVRVDGTDKADVVFYDDAGYRRLTAPNPADPNDERAKRIIKANIGNVPVDVLAHYPDLKPERKPIESADISHAKRKLAGGNLSIKGNATSEPITSDLSGEKIRRYIELPNGARIHPDELQRAKSSEGEVYLDPHEGISIKDPANKGESQAESFNQALRETSMVGHSDDRVTLQTPHGYSVTKTRSEWREVAELHQGGSMSSWYDRENPEAVSEAAAKSEKPAATMGGEDESADFFKAPAEQQGLYSWDTPDVNAETAEDKAVKAKYADKPKIELLRAPAGGKTSDVDGVFYKGGRLMPVHGLSPKTDKSKGDGTGAGTAVKADEDKTKSSTRKSRNTEMSPEDIEAEKQKRERQTKWDEVRSGPIGQFISMGERAHHVKRAIPGLTGWQKWADTVPDEKLAEIRDAARDMATKAMAAKNGNDDAKEYREYQDEWFANKPNEYMKKGHAKNKPTSQAALHWVGEAIDNGGVDAMHQLHQIMTSAIPPPKRKPETPKSVKDAADMLQSVRNDLARGNVDSDELASRTDAIGEWVASNGKNTGLAAKLLNEASMLRDKIGGGSGKGGTRIEVNAPSKPKADLKEMMDAAKAFQFLAVKEEPEDSEGRAKVREHQSHTNKAGLDKWLMNKFGIDAAEARSISNRVGEDDAPWYVSNGKVMWRPSGGNEPTGEGMDLPWRASKTETPESAAPALTGMHKASNSEKSPQSVNNTVDLPNGEVKIPSTAAIETAKADESKGKKMNDLLPKPADGSRVFRATEVSISKDDVETREKLKADGWKYSSGSRTWYKRGHHPDAPGKVTHHIMAEANKNAGVGQAAWDEEHKARAEVDEYYQNHVKKLRDDGHEVKPTNATDGRYAGTPLINSRYHVVQKATSAPSAADETAKNEPVTPERMTRKEAIEFMNSKEWPAGAQSKQRLDNIFADKDIEDTMPVALIIERLSKPIKGQPERMSDKMGFRMLDNGNDK